MIRYEHGANNGDDHAKNKRYLPDASNVLANCLGGHKRTAMGAFFPDELLSGQQTSRKAFRSVRHAATKGGANLDELAKREASGVRGGSDNEDDDEEYPEDDGEEEEENADYTKNYYESDDDDGGGGGDDDGEPVF